jgi:hypothetical protein
MELRVSNDLSEQNEDRQKQQGEIPRWNRRSSDSIQESNRLSKIRPSSESVQLSLSEQELQAAAGARYVAICR